MTAPYTNQLINRVRQDIAYSQARNRSVGNTMPISVASRMVLPSVGSLGLGALSGNAQVLGSFTDSHGTRLATIRTPWGESVTVNAAKAPTFAKLFNGLNALGYKPRSAQGYNYRNIAGTNVLSKHALGLAVDLDPQQNKGGRLGGTPGPRYGYFDPAKVMALARSLGMSWGATFKNPDPMHFSFGEG
jgi:hypothetical protein